MGLLASLKVMLGIDSVDYQAKLRGASDSASIFENNFGQRSTMVERHGLRLVRTAEGVSGAMQRMSVDAGGAIAELASSAGFGNLAIAVAGAAATYGVLNAAAKAFMATTMTAGKPLGEMTAGLVGNQVAVDNLVGQIDLFAKRLGSSAEAMGVTNAATAENVAGLLALRDSLEKEAIARRNSSEGYKTYLIQQKLVTEKTAEEKKLRAESTATLDAAREAQIRFNAEHGKFVPIAAQVAIALAAGAQKQKEFGDETRKTLGVMNAEDLRAKADLLQKQVIAIAQSGGSATQTVGALGDQISNIMAVAKELGVSLDPQFTDMAEAIGKGPGLAMDDLFARFKGMPKEVEASRAASKSALDKLGEDLKGSVKGGLTDGLHEGLDTMQEELANAAVGLKVTIPVEFAQPDLGNLIRSIIRNERPNTGGSVGAGG